MSSSPSQPILSLVMPVFNEVLTIGEILRRVQRVPLAKELVIVDDGSTDGTREYLQRLQAHPEIAFSQADAHPCQLKVLFHEENRGKGAAVRTGIQACTGDVTVIQDADLEYDPNDLPRMVELITSGQADAVYGSRFRGETARILFFWHALGNALVTFVSNVFSNLNLTDVETGYKAIRTSILQTIPIRSNGFGFEIEITAKLAKLRCRLYEVPIAYHGRSYDEGKKIRWTDGIWAILTAIRFWLTDDLYEQQAGLRTLRIMEGAGSYNRWLFARCKPFLRKRVMEMGAGVGNITKFLLDREFVLATDVTPSYVEELAEKFAYLPHVTVREVDMLNDSHVSSCAREQIDTVLSMNVLEHIENDRRALENTFSILTPGGRLVLLVPAHQWLYSKMDKNIDHFRRYDKKGLTSLVEAAGFRVLESTYLNWLGALGWFFNGRILRRELIPTRQLRLFDFLIVLLRFEKWIQPPFGLSLLIVADKPAQPTA